MSNSAHGHRKTGRRQPAPKREPSLDQALICFLEARGAYQRGRRGLDFRAAVLALVADAVTVDDSKFNRSLWKGHDIHIVVSRNGVGNQGKSPGRTFGELVIYSPGLRSAASIRKAA